MHDIRVIRENPSEFDAVMARRGLAPVSGHILKLDEERRSKILAAETAQAAQNKAAKEIGAAKASGDTALFEKLRDEVAAQKAEVATLQVEAKTLDAALTEMLGALPNLLHDDVPVGADEADNSEVRSWGTPATLNFSAREHFELECVKLGMDFETAAKLSGSRFVVLSGSVARLHRALAQLMLDTHIEENGLTETWTPVLVKEEMMYGTGQLPKFGEDSYQTTNGWWLVPTAEVTLTNIVNGMTVEENTLPRRFVAHTQCFRSEAGSAGRDTSGMLRQHQFEKVEMVSITHPDKSLEEHDRMTRCAEGILEKLELPYRTVVLCTGDIGFGAIKTHDIEVWLPGQGKYREISSVSVCGDFQARRMQARFKPADGGKPQHVHTLNGSGLAVGRALIAVLENGQQEDGSVILPKALHPYVGGKTTLNVDGSLC
ncbi:MULTISPECIES: serine--tRNA ligase [Lentibacter]|mgnify:FL=1|jgi:seryl-tRNA synthetase|uniref:Serine--tRNA ligase n=2 Tax=Lentibacter algarum TaxID=576131 RepID=A0A1H3KER8_9RHOB|nr:serine--tRNA ligase [Lentibacter algarum]MCO4776242.1 serine--tRNA ligase [Lentibacter algarum]WIF32006.1 seryl-tRNA synthetase SerS [Lentibacter algarum]SDY50064.1 seryl-tRNA synthetase [Lentibacter algarum]